MINRDRYQNCDFLGKLNGIDIAIFKASVTRIRYRITLEGLMIGAGDFTKWVLHPASPITPSVKEFISLRI